jgi:aryl-alcohol dehydrogenase-like predicted oxidoreductase
MAALTRAVEKGKARYLGFSEWTPTQIAGSLTLPGAHFVSSQPQYSMLWRAPEKEVFPFCAKNGIGQIVWSPLAQGVLTGKYLPGKPVPADSRAKAQQAWGTDFMQEFLTKEVLQAVQALRPIAEELDASIAQLALAWVLRRSEVSSAIVGVTRPEQLEENAGATKIVLKPEHLTRIDEVLAPVAGCRGLERPGEVFDC